MISHILASILLLPLVQNYNVDNVADDNKNNNNNNSSSSSINNNITSDFASSSSTMDARTEQRLRERWSAILNERTRPVSIDALASSPADVHAVAGKDIYLTCAVSRALTGRARVSFMRLSDLNLLSVGKRLHTPDERIEVVHSEIDAPRVWTIKIRDARASDSGRYECQVNTSPTTTRRIFLVRVAEPDISMEPPEEVVYLNAGSKLALTCSVYTGGLTPQFIMWYRDDRIISYSSKGSEDNQDNNNGVKTKMWSGEVDNSTINSVYPRHFSRLTIDSVSQDDSGEYRCDSDLTGEASVNVYVVRADLKSLASDQHVVAAAAAGEVLSSNEENKASVALKLTLDLKAMLILLAVTYLLRG